MNSFCCILSLFNLFCIKFFKFKFVSALGSTTNHQNNSTKLNCVDYNQKLCFSNILADLGENMIGLNMLGIQVDKCFLM